METARASEHTKSNQRGRGDTSRHTNATGDNRENRWSILSPFPLVQYSLRARSRRTSSLTAKKGRMKEKPQANLQAQIALGGNLMVVFLLSALHKKYRTQIGRAHV